MDGELHAHEKEKNEKPNFIWISILYGNYRTNWRDRDSNRFGRWSSLNKPKGLDRGRHQRSGGSSLSIGVGVVIGIVSGNGGGGWSRNSDRGGVIKVRKGEHCKELD